MSSKKILCVDFDGVCHRYSRGWQGGVLYDTYVPGLFKWLDQVMKTFRVVIYSSRSSNMQGITDMMDWFRRESMEAVEKGEIPADYNWTEFFTTLEFADRKPSAWLTIDDRAVRFNGDWSDPMWSPESLHKFKPWTAELTIDDMKAQVEYLQVAHYRAVQRLNKAQAALLKPEADREKLEAGPEETLLVSTHEIMNEDGHAEPLKGSFWQHRDGKRYIVVHLANKFGRPKYPRTVVYAEIDADGWSKDDLYAGPVSDWRPRMTPI